MASWCCAHGRDAFPADLLYSRNAEVGRIITMVAATVKRDCLYDPADPDERAQEGKRKLKVRRKGGGGGLF